MSLFERVRARLRLSRAKHRSLHGHARLALRLSRILPFYEYDEASCFAIDGAPPDVVVRRRDGFARLSERLTARAPRTLAASDELAASLPDVAFVTAYRVPFQFRRVVGDRLKIGCVVAETDGERVADLDGNWAYDLGGSYGVNLFGNEFYKRCIERGVARAGQLGLVLGSYHPVVADNVRRLREISRLDEVSFHMSGTEAVMQAVRLARYHTGRSHVVRFCGAYHGWWDGVQAGIGNPRPAREVYTLAEMDPATLRVLETRRDIACVLVNPIQALHPNAAPASDSTLIASDRAARYDKAGYARWLRQLRDVCTRRGIALVFDEVFLGFRLARGGAQDYFGVRADLVTYGKSLGGGLPVGVVCGTRAYMRRFRDDRPSDVCFARGTFNSHPYVMATMNEFLRALDEPEIAATYDRIDERWDGRAGALNRRLAALELPVRVANLTSVMTTLYLVPGRYNWMFQFYLRAEGLALSWVGTGRFIFSHDTSDATFQAVSDRFVAAASAMRCDGFWWHATELTNRSIKRRVLRELVSAGLARRASGPATRRGAGAAEPGDRSSRRETDR